MMMDVLKIICVLLDFTKLNLYVGVFKEYVVNARGSWLFL